MNTESIVLERTLPHPPERVWRLLTEPALLATWWAESTIAPEVGQRFTLDMDHWGTQQCTVLAVEPERLISYTFAEGVLDTTLTWTLEPAEGGTLLRLEHAGFDMGSKMGPIAFKGMGGGWPGVLERLAQAAPAA